jgi:dTDP-4-dehydrorhamnose reductase
MTVLLIGNNGQLGWALERRAKMAGSPAIGMDLPDLDITSAQAIAKVVSRRPYAMVVNAAAYTAVDKAENDAETAFSVNRDGVAHLADACRKNEIPLVHISTDYVFDGKGDVPYKASDPIAPLGVYGKSKAAGEAEVRERLKRHIIIRTSWLYGVHGNNFVKTMIRLARERKDLRVVDDQKGCPTYAEDLADAIVKIIEQFNHIGDAAWGTYHYCNAGVTTWYQLACKTIDLASTYEKFLVEKIVPVTTADYPTPAPRPSYSVLDCSSFTADFDIGTLPWEASLDAMISLFYDRSSVA